MTAFGWHSENPFHCSYNPISYSSQLTTLREPSRARVQTLHNRKGQALPLIFIGLSSSRRRRTIVVHFGSVPAPGGAEDARVLDLAMSNATAAMKNPLNVHRVQRVSV